MKKYYAIGFAVLLVSLLIVSVAPASAGAALINTPRPTLTQISTPGATQDFALDMDFDCPGGQVAGEGTLTPSVDWSLACGHCLSNVNDLNPTMTQYAPTWDGVGTPPVATGTALPAGTQLATATDIVFGGGGGSAGSGQGGGAPTLVSGSLTCGTVQNYNGASGSCSPYQNGIRLDWNMSLSDSGLSPVSSVDFIYQTTSPVTALYAVMDATATGSRFWYGSPTVDTHNRFLALQDTNLLSTGTYPATGNGGVHANATGAGNLQSQGYVTVSAAVESGDGSFSGSIYIMPQEVIGTPTESPSGGDLTGSYCETIHTETSDAEFFNVEWGAVVAQECATIGGFSLAEYLSTVAVLANMPWLDEFLLFILEPTGLTDFVFEPWTICIRSVDFSLTFLGIEMPIFGIMAFAVFVAGLRFWIGSLRGFAGEVGNQFDIDVHGGL